MMLDQVNPDEATISLPTRALRDGAWNYRGDRLNAIWQNEPPIVCGVDIRVARGRATGEPLEKLTAPPSLPKAPMQPSETGGKKMEDPDRLTVSLEPRFTFQRFIVGKPNELGYACARRVAESPAAQGFNPLFLHGGVGLGKTHLMHAIGWELDAQRNERPYSVIYMSAERFMYQFIASIRNQSTIEFKEQLRNVDVLMVDDLQFLIGKDNTQEEFFHTFNALVDAGKQIVVSADKSPSDLSGLEDRLRTRLGCGMVADLHATTFELRIAILEAKAAEAAAHIMPKVLEFLAQRIISSRKLRFAKVVDG